MEFVIPPTGEQIEPQDVAEIESYVGRPGPWIPPLQSEPQEFVWFEDDIPEGARPWENWNFNSQQPVFAGAKATTRVGTGIIQDVFEGASYQLRLGEGDKFFVMVYLDPENPPKCLMLQFNDGLSWEHRAYWGADVISWGSGDNEGHRRIGDLPVITLEHWHYDSYRLSWPDATLNTAGPTLLTVELDAAGRPARVVIRGPMLDADAVYEAVGD